MRLSLSDVNFKQKAKRRIKTSEKQSERQLPFTTLPRMFPFLCSERVFAPIFIFASFKDFHNKIYEQKQKNMPKTYINIDKKQCEVIK